MYGLIIASYVARSEMKRRQSPDAFASTLDFERRRAGRTLAGVVAGLAGLGVFLQVLSALR